MKLRDVRTKLAARLRRNKQHDDDKGKASFPSLNDMASTSLVQNGTALMRLPLEIRNLIFNYLWSDAGDTQHIIYRNGRYTSSKCVTNHSAPDMLMEECAKYRTSRFQDETLWRWMTSTWGNHWKCQEVYDADRSKSGHGVFGSPFLTMMLVCKQLYIECRTSIYSTLTFVIHDVETLHKLTVGQRSPIINDIRHLNIAIRLPIRRESKKEMSTEAHAVLERWRECCNALDRAQGLASVDMWLDTTEPVWRSVLSSVPDGRASPFVFGERLARILIVDLPVNFGRPQAWKQVAGIKPRFSIRARGWPAYRAEMEATTVAAYSIIKLWETTEPGVLQTSLVFGTHYAH